MVHVEESVGDEEKFPRVCDEPLGGVGKLYQYIVDSLKNNLYNRKGLAVILPLSETRTMSGWDFMTTKTIFLYLGRRKMGWGPRRPKRVYHLILVGATLYLLEFYNPKIFKKIDCGEK